MDLTKHPFYVVIPARYGSSRLPGKPLRELAGKPIIVHVCERAAQSSAEKVIVATDDKRVLRAVTAAGYEALMTRRDHNSGTDRLAEVAERLAWAESDIVVNVQGDEPLISCSLIDEVAHSLRGGDTASVSTLASQIKNTDEIFDPKVVKVVVDRLGFGLYFSRAPIPWDRENFREPKKRLLTHSKYLRHIGIYAYTANFLARYASWPPCPSESIERLEQLRILWHGDRIRVVEVSETPEAGVDTEEDLTRMESLMKNQNPV